MFLDRAAKLVRDGSSYKNLVGRVSGVLGRNLNEDVMQTLIDPLNKQTKAQLLLDGASNASIKLLQRWPDLTTKLYGCLNRPLPSNLRKAVWKMCLANPIVRQEYLDKALRNKRETVSAHDAAISPGLLIFRAVAEPRNSGFSAKSRVIHKNTGNTAKFARNPTKYMSVQHI